MNSFSPKRWPAFTGYSTLLPELEMTPLPEIPLPITLEDDEPLSDKPEFLIVTDKDSSVILSCHDLASIRKTASLIRKAGGDVTVFKETKY